MATDASPTQDAPHSPLENTKASLDRIKKQLTASGRFLLQGSLLKRSETLRKWNQRWFTLDPTTGKMEYRIERGDTMPKGFIIFDAFSTITISPINFQGLPKYDGCCIYIETMAKKEYFLCAETPGAAQAWVSTLQAAQLVLKAHKEAVNSLGGSGSSKLGTVAAVVAAANATAKEAAKVIAVAMQASTKAALKSITPHGNDGFMDDLSIMKETLRVKDDELHQMARELRARDATIKDMADRLSETAEAAEAAASAAHIMDKERKAVRTEIAKLRREFDEKLRLSALELKAAEEKILAVEKARNEALQEAHTWRAELAKAREHAVVMEAALIRAEEGAKHATADAELKVKHCLEREAVAMSAKDAAEKEVEFLRLGLKSAVNSGNYSRDVETVLSHSPVEVDAEKHISMNYSSASEEPHLAVEARVTQSDIMVTPIVVLSSYQGELDGQIANVQNRAENAVEVTAGCSSLEQQKAEAPESISLNDKEVDGLIDGACAQDISINDVDLTWTQGES